MASAGRRKEMTRRNKLLASVLVVGVLGTVAAGGVFGVFSATTQNAGNEISTGTVSLSDNDGGSAMFNIANAKPGESWTRCIKVSYAGTLPADVHMYLKDATGPLATYLSLTIKQGSQAAATFPSCTGFTPDATNGNGTVFQGPVQSPVPGSWDASLTLNPFGQTSWAPGTTQVYQFEMLLDPAAPDTVQGSSTGTMTAVWEARNH
jgi:hypothetical protein